ncbi:MAG TPA: hypothetical protein VFD38_17550 [Myxococcaceae bacterium]|nr:hypothetical protein [Myxococcaceae bacterium]
MTSETKDEILLKLQAAQILSSEEPEKAELFLRSALKGAEALGHSSPTLHLQLAELLYRLRRTRQALEQVIEVLELDPFNLVALSLKEVLGRRLR